MRCSRVLLGILLRQLHGPHSSDDGRRSLALGSEDGSLCSALTILCLFSIHAFCFSSSLRYTYIMILTYGNEYKFDDVCIHIQLPKHTAESAVWEECLALHLFGFD